MELHAAPICNDVYTKCHLASASCESEFCCVLYPRNKHMDIVGHLSIIKKLSTTTFCATYKYLYSCCNLCVDTAL